jgi:hypothetical protein
MYPKLITKLVNDYVTNIEKVVKGSPDFKIKTKILRKCLKDISITHDICLIDDIDVIMVFNIYNNVYINSDRVMLYVLNNNIEINVRKKYSRSVKKKNIKHSIRDDRNIKSIINLNGVTWNGV